MGRRPFFTTALIVGGTALVIAGKCPNGAIPLTQTFNRVKFYYCNQYFGARKANNGDPEIAMYTAILMYRSIITSHIKLVFSFLLFHPLRTFYYPYLLAATQKKSNDVKCLKILNPMSDSSFKRGTFNVEYPFHRQTFMLKCGKIHIVFDIRQAVQLTTLLDRIDFSRTVQNKTLETRV